MAIHDKENFVHAWVVVDEKFHYNDHVGVYDDWLVYREDLNIGYILPRPRKSNLPTLCMSHSQNFVHVTIFHTKVIGFSNIEEFAFLCRWSPATQPWSLTHVQDPHHHPH